MKKKAIRKRAASFRKKLETQTQEMSQKLSQQSFVRETLKGVKATKLSCKTSKKKKG